MKPNSSVGLDMFDNRNLCDYMMSPVHSTLTYSIMECLAKLLNGKTMLKYEYRPAVLLYAR